MAAEKFRLAQRRGSKTSGGGGIGSDLNKGIQVGAGAPDPRASIATRRKQEQIAITGPSASINGSSSPDRSGPYNRKNSIGNDSQSIHSSDSRSILTPRFMPSLLNNISQRLLPSDIEPLPTLYKGYQVKVDGNLDDGKESQHSNYHSAIDLSTNHGNHNGGHDQRRRLYSNPHQHSEYGGHQLHDTNREENTVNESNQYYGATDDYHGTMKIHSSQSRMFNLREGPASLKYSSHLDESLNQSSTQYDSRYSSEYTEVSPRGSFDGDDASIFISEGSHNSNRRLRMETIFNEYSEAATQNINVMKQTTRKRMHEKSKSADFTDFLVENKDFLQTVSRDGHYSKLPSQQSRSTLSTQVNSFPMERIEGMKSTPDKFIRVANAGFPPKQFDGDGHSCVSDIHPDDDISFADNEHYEESPFLSPNSRFQPLHKVQSHRTATISQLGNSTDGYGRDGRIRSTRHKIFVLLTDPHSCLLSFCWFLVIIILILSSNILMVVQTMNKFQYTPDACDFCTAYSSSRAPTHQDDTNYRMLTAQSDHCVCPPVAVTWIPMVEGWIITCLSVEWITRVLCYDPPSEDDEMVRGNCNPFASTLTYATGSTAMIDALATFPYFALRYNTTAHGLITLNLLRVFRVFQLIRLGQYDETFCTLVNVLAKSMQVFNMLAMVLIFCAGFFGSVIYWFERGVWKYTDLVDPPGFAYVRHSIDGAHEEVSPFRSIPDSFWWFFVTATTVGYGDISPTSWGGKIVASVAMLVGVLVIAFPVSVFAEKWREFSGMREFENLEEASMNKALPKYISAKFDHQSKSPNRSTFLDVSKSEGSLVFTPGKDKKKDMKVNVSDVDAIREYMCVIDDAQAKIRNILENMET